MSGIGNGAGVRLRSILKWSTAIVLVAAWPAVAQQFSFDNVVIEGNQRIEAGTILTYAGISRGQAMSAGQLNDAAQRIRESGLFETVDIQPQGGTLRIVVTEYPTINRIAFEGNSQLSSDRLGQLISSETRRVFNPNTAEADVAAITAAYGEIGRVNAVVSPAIIRQSDNRVDLVFQVAEGGVTEIERIGFVGNRSFGEYRLRGILETKQAGILRNIIGRDTYAADRAALDRQLLTDFYNSRGYPDFTIQNVDVQLTRERDAYLVTYHIQEGQQFTFGNVTVTSTIPEADAAVFQDVIRLRAGQTYSPSLLEQDIDRIEREATRRGINFLRVDPKITRVPSAKVPSVSAPWAISRMPRSMPVRGRVPIRWSSMSMWSSSPPALCPSGPISRPTAALPSSPPIPSATSLAAASC